MRRVARPSPTKPTHIVQQRQYLDDSIECAAGIMMEVMESIGYAKLPV